VCADLIYTEAFDGMPGVMKERVYQRLFDVLSGKDNSPKFSNLTAADKRAILEILIATKRVLPGFCRLGVRDQIIKIQRPYSF
jgi:hypothetical protein